MPWKLRNGNEWSDEKEKARLADQDAFTLRIHHSGKFRLRNGKKIYVGGKTAYVDYCRKSELYMEDFSYMGAELGLTGFYEFYYSCNGDDTCEQLTRMKNLYNIDELDCLVGIGLYISVFIDHEYLDESVISFDVEPGDKSLPQFSGENVESSLSRLIEDYDEVGGGQDVTKSKAPEDERVFDEHGVSDDIVAERLRRVFGEQVDEAESEGEVSFGEDSENSDYMEDSDACYEQDSSDFYKYVDSDEELGSKSDIKSKRPMTRMQYVKERETALKKPVEVNMKKPAANTYKGFKLFNPRTDMDHIDFHVGLSFIDIPTFRMALKRYAVQNGRALRFTLNRPNKVQAKCKDVKCPWVIYGSKVPTDDTVQVKTLIDTHTCVRQEKILQADANYIADLYKLKLKSDPNWPVHSMIEVIQAELGCLVSRWQMYRVKKKIANMDNGDELEQFASLYKYAEEIFRSNPNSTCKIKTTVIEGKAVFKRMYICWAALKEGMLDGCRRMICLDGCHLRNQTGGVLLTAVGIDANNGMYPFAYAVAEKETYKSWLWFLDLVIKDLGISPEESFRWIVMSDKQKGLVEAVSELLPNAESRFCVRHLYANFKLTFKGVKLRDIVWRAARATRPVDFQRVLNHAKGNAPSAVEWIAKRSPQHWSKAHFKTHNNTDMIVNNLSESFNALILKARGKPIVKMLENIRRILMKRIGVNRKEMLKHSGDLCPNIQKLLDLYKIKSYGWAPTWNGRQEFEVSGPNDMFFCVHLEDRTCGCRRWQLSGIPCQHAISCMHYMGYKAEDYVAECYRKETYLRIYDHYMSPLQSIDEWPAPDEERLEIVPPKRQKMPGRPKKHKRKLEPGEVIGTAKHGKLKRKGLVSTCQQCKQKGHNSRTCPLNTGSTSKGLDIPPPTENDTSVSDAQPTKKKMKSTATPAAQPTRKSPRKNVKSIAPSASQPVRTCPGKEMKSIAPSFSQPSRTCPKENEKSIASSSSQPTKPLNLSLASQRSSYIPLFSAAPRRNFICKKP